jgi:two-component system response regulator GlrR
MEVVLADSSKGAEVLRTRPVGRRREDRIVGASQTTRDVIEQATVAARTDLPVLVTGPRGSDKEQVARAIHAWGPRHAQRFETLFAGATPEALQGRELFGCAEGVYPAVPGEHLGALQRCAGGTLWIDQVETLSGSVRQALVKAVVERRFRREGGDAPQELTCRVILGGESITGASLFGDAPNHQIRIQPLSSRPEDVLPLAAHYLAAFAEEAGLQPVGFAADARACLLAEPWTGDVLELRERIRQAVSLSGSGAISAESLLLAREGEEVPSFKEAKRAFETRYVCSLLRRCGGNISRAARLAKKDRKDFYDVIRRTGVDPSEFR